MKITFILLFTYLFITGCEKEEETLAEPEVQLQIEKNNVLAEIDILTDAELLNHSNCFWITNIKADSGFVVRDYNTYRKYSDSLLAEIPIDNCEPANLMDIDFKKYTLIGIMTAYGPCDSISKNIALDTVNKKIIYTIDIVSLNQYSCESILFLSLNPALITRIPDQYEVKFKINRIPLADQTN